MTKAIKISEENYVWLSKVAGNLQMEKGKHVSIDEAISHLKGKRGSILDLAGTWDMSDKEAQDLKRTLREGWKSWKIRSA